MSYNTPILFLIFNRPDQTRRVFEAIRAQKPAYLFVAADGPRADKSGEQELCEATRLIVSEIDWPCNIKTLYRTANLGCKAAVSAAITWFFDQVDEGIILEDDCLPDASFFPFCTELLEKYRSDIKVMSISGSNLLDKPWRADAQSYFWGFGGIWGWATWKRAWKLYDKEMKDWESPATKKLIRKALKTANWYRFYYPMLESSYNGSLDTWDLQWFYTILINNGTAINPAVNLVTNIGFAAGTHMNSDEHPTASLSLNEMPFPLKHPLKQEVDIKYLEVMYREVYGRFEKRSLPLKNILSVVNRNLLHRK